MQLLPRSALVKTGPVDHAEHNFRPLLGFIQKTRFRLITKLLGNRGKVARLVELGSGSGVFLPELARHCEELYGIDIHSEQGKVRCRLEEYGIDAMLLTCSAEKLPFMSNAFDRVVAVSVLEFIEDLDATCVEIRRILKNNGELLVVLPGRSWILDTGYYLLTGGVSCCGGEEDRRHRTFPTLLKYFKVTSENNFPHLVPRWLRLYFVLKLTPADHEEARDKQRL